MAGQGLVSKKELSMVIKYSGKTNMSQKYQLRHLTIKKKMRKHTSHMSNRHPADKWPLKLPLKNKLFKPFEFCYYSNYRMHIVS
jgi:hypothetical protein